MYQFVKSLLFVLCYRWLYELGEFRDLVKEVVRSACRTALLEAGFTPDDYFYDGMESPGLFGGKIFFKCYIISLVSYQLKNVVSAKQVAVQKCTKRCI